MMNQPPPRGLTLRQAIFALVREPLLSTVPSFLQAEPHYPSDDPQLTRIRSDYWADIRAQLYHGDLTMMARRHRKEEFRPVDATFFASEVRLDYTENTVESAGVVLFGVLIFAAGSPAKEATPRASDKTGGPGRPSSMHLITKEMERRAAAGVMITKTMKAEAEVLAAWAGREHSDLATPTAKLIQNKLGGLHWRLKRSQN